MVPLMMASIMITEATADCKVLPQDVSVISDSSSSLTLVIYILLLKNMDNTLLLYHRRGREARELARSRACGRWLWKIGFGLIKLSVCYSFERLLCYLLPESFETGWVQQLLELSRAFSGATLFQMISVFLIMKVTGHVLRAIRTYWGGGNHHTNTD
ncbi:hypothetical protein BDV95DRAFT_310337 [Massariosphaeria phaeospora]|uniref:Uncharacterized protein n=1 Tax=Massariosphaeria phaeospora TaxID=100035 RepID=A0A7C8MA88_9PLEO|nr:hypothetical protein BDV95DRAFT_310337 [Massariosphaeria phaeospora]